MKQRHSRRWAIHAFCDLLAIAAGVSMIGIDANTYLTLLGLILVMVYALLFVEHVIAYIFILRN